MPKGALFHDSGALTVTVPMTFRKRGGRKLVIAPNGAMRGRCPAPASITPWSRRWPAPTAGKSRSTLGASRPSRT